MINYSLFDKLLHKVSFNILIQKTLYFIEKSIYLNDPEKINNEKNIFVTGLARSGTTTLLNYIYLSDNYASLTYKDMPFILSVNINDILFKNNYVKQSKRLHNDNIDFNISSPEAFDEVFFKCFDDKNFDEYLNYIKLITNKYNKKKIISKNNNYYKRLNLIKQKFPNSLFLLCYRDPLQQAFSLFNQHKNFKNIQEKDRFILDYMNFLGHREFGYGHRSWHEGKQKNFDEYNYWLEQWILFYKNIIRDHKKNAVFISYEKICMDNTYLRKFNKLVDIPYNQGKKFFKVSEIQIDEKIDPNLKNLAYKIYQHMSNLDLN